MKKLPTINDLSTEEKICFLEMMSSLIGHDPCNYYCGFCYAYVEVAKIFDIKVDSLLWHRNKSDIAGLVNTKLPDFGYLFDRDWNGTRKRRRLINNAIKRLQSQTK